MLRILLLWTLFSALLSSCIPIGFSLSLKNPAIPKAIPSPSPEEQLLGPLTAVRSNYDVHYYDLAIDFEPEKQSVQGTVEIHARALADLDRLQIDLHPNLEILQFVDQATGQALSYKRQERAVFVNVDLRTDQPFVLAITYQGIPPQSKKLSRAYEKAGFYWKQDDEDNPWVGVKSSWDGPSLWWPLKDHNSDEPDSVRMHYTVPEGLTAVGNGQEEGHTTSGGRTTWNWFVSYPINPDGVTVYIGKYKALKQSYTGIHGQSLDITHYVLPAHYEQAQQHFAQILPMLTFFETQFGEYPWYRDGFRLVESPNSGIDHQTANAFGNRYENDFENRLDFTLCHILAHEWWGNSVSVPDYAHDWLQEGFAQYAEWLYLENAFGKEPYLEWVYYKQGFVNNQYPLVGPEGRRYFAPLNFQNISSKGANVLHLLRQQMNNDHLFFSILREFYQRNRYQLVTTEDFIALVQELSGKNYRWFFDQYVYKREVPELEFAFTNGGLLYTRWVNTSPDFNQYRVLLETQDGTLHGVTPTNQIQIVKLPSEAGSTFNLRFLDNQLVIFKKNNELLGAFE